MAARLRSRRSYRSRRAGTDEPQMGQACRGGRSSVGLRDANEAAAGIGMSLDKLAGGNGERHDRLAGLSDREAVALALAVQTLPMIRMKERRQILKAGLAKLLARVSAEMRERIAVHSE